jgi:DNA processing protein
MTLQMDVTKSEIERWRAFTVLLSKTDGVGCITFQELLTEYHSIAGIMEAADRGDLPDELQSNLAEAMNVDWLSRIPSHMNYVCIWEDHYPVALQSISDPPIILFYMGDYNIINSPRIISIVGTRTLSTYGKNMTKMLISGLVSNDFTIVSGMAAGIDAHAHLAALESKGKTIAVLPGPVDQPTPSRNSQLYNRILAEGGLIISEMLPGTIITPGMFAFRNRIIAGLSPATVVIEAAEQSGALITANAAFDYGREVMAVPGRNFDNSSKGCNTLIKIGKGHLVESVLDILNLLNCKPASPMLSTSIANLNNEELNLYKLVRSGTQSLERICSLVDRRADDVISLLMLLQMHGLVDQDEFGDYFATK